MARKRRKSKSSQERPFRSELTKMASPASKPVQNAENQDGSKKVTGKARRNSSTAGRKRKRSFNDSAAAAIEPPKVKYSKTSAVPDSHAKSRSMAEVPAAPTPWHEALSQLDEQMNLQTRQFDKPSHSRSATVPDSPSKDSSPIPSSTLKPWYEVLNLLDEELNSEERRPDMPLQNRQRKHQNDYALKTNTAMHYYEHCALAHEHISRHQMKKLVGRMAPSDLQQMMEASKFFDRKDPTSVSPDHGKIVTKFEIQSLKEWYCADGAAGWDVYLKQFWRMPLELQDTILNEAKRRRRQSKKMRANIKTKQLQLAKSRATNQSPSQRAPLVGHAQGKPNHKSTPQTSSQVPIKEGKLSEPPVTKAKGKRRTKAEKEAESKSHLSPLGKPTNELNTAVKTSASAQRRKSIKTLPESVPDLMSNRLSDDSASSISPMTPLEGGLLGKAPKAQLANITVKADVQASANKSQPQNGTTFQKSPSISHQQNLIYLLSDDWKTKRTRRERAICADLRMSHGEMQYDRLIYTGELGKRVKERKGKLKKAGDKQKRESCNQQVVNETEAESEESELDDEARKPEIATLEPQEQGAESPAHEDPLSSADGSSGSDAIEQTFYSTTLSSGNRGPNAFKGGKGKWLSVSEDETSKKTSTIVDQRKRGEERPTCDDETSHSDDSSDFEVVEQTLYSTNLGLDYLGPNAFKGVKRKRWADDESVAESEDSSDSSVSHEPSIPTNLPGPEPIDTTPVKNQNAKKQAGKAGSTKSPYFPAKKATTPKPKKPSSKSSLNADGTNKSASIVVKPPIVSKNFGLIQEQYSDKPFYLLLACLFLSRTRSQAALDVFFAVERNYPTVEKLSYADAKTLYEMIERLGFGHNRVAAILGRAHIWLGIHSPDDSDVDDSFYKKTQGKAATRLGRPKRGLRYRTLHYPVHGAGFDIGTNEVVGDEEGMESVEGFGSQNHESKYFGNGFKAVNSSQPATHSPVKSDTRSATDPDPRSGAFEIHYLPGIGLYSMDSWRIFCRDVCRGVAIDYDGGRAGKKALELPVDDDDVNSSSDGDVEDVSNRKAKIVKPGEPEWPLCCRGIDVPVLPNGSQMAIRRPKAYLPADWDIIVPVPRAPNTKRKRGDPTREPTMQPAVQQPDISISTSLRNICKDKPLPPPFEPEWKRVLPKDKELRAYLKWMWERDGWSWNPYTGEKIPLALAPAKESNSEE